MEESAETPMKWTAAHELALSLAFEGRWTQDEMAASVHISARTLRRWQAHPDFQARLEALRQDFAASIRDVVYAEKAQRVIALSQMAESARRLYEARPWIVETWRGRDGAATTNEAFNASAYAAFRGALDDIAKERGHRTAKADTSGQIALIAVASDVLDAL